MSPRPGGRGRDWLDFSTAAAPRREVSGGVAVPRTWKPSTEEAARLVVVAEGRTTPGIASRGRTYARAGQVVEVRVDDGVASAAIQGSDAAPYAVSLTRLADGDVDATCTCPYGCDDVEWCKHAAALAVVVAHLTETVPDVAGAWSGTADGADGASEGGAAGDDTAATRPGASLPADVPALVAALHGPAPAADARERWAAALEVLPLP
jgi:hypothetical protein